jgi:hypothetical protein
MIKTVRKERLRAMYAAIRTYKGKAAACAELAITEAGVKSVQEGFAYIDYHKDKCSCPQAQLAGNGFGDLDDFDVPDNLAHYTPDDYSEMVRGYAVAESLLAVLDCEQVTCDQSPGCACDICMIGRHLTGNKGA